MRRKAFVCGFAVMLVVFLVGCTAGPNVLKDSPDSDGSVAGFWLGLWQGMILPLAFVISLFSDNVSIYEVHNSGGWYNLGFLLGVAMIWGGGGAAASELQEEDQERDQDELKEELRDELREEMREEMERLPEFESQREEYIPDQARGDSSSHLTPEQLVERERKQRETEKQESEAREFLRRESERVLKEREEQREGEK